MAKPKKMLLLLTKAEARLLCDAVGDCANTLEQHDALASDARRIRAIEAKIERLLYDK